MSLGPGRPSAALMSARVDVSRLAVSKCGLRPDPGYDVADIGRANRGGARMRYVGRLTDWHDDKGYGFVVPHDGGDRAFVHIKAFERPGRRPAVGDLVSYAIARDARGRRNAVQLRFAGARPI